jgi:hypothetical protein
MNLEMVMLVSKTSSPCPIKRAARCPFWREVLSFLSSLNPSLIYLQSATNHIVQLEKLNQQLQKKILGLNAEISRLQNLNEKISLNNANTPSPGMSMGVDSRPLSPPPEASNLSQLTSVSGQEPPREDSPPSSDGDF